MSSDETSDELVVALTPAQLVAVVGLLVALVLILRAKKARAE